MKSTLEKSTPSADYLRRGRRSRQKPSSCAHPGWLDAGGSGRTQRRSCHRGQPDRERQARSAGLDGGTTRQGGRSLAERSAALTNGPAPFPVRAAGDRPSNGCLVLLEDLQQRHDLPDRFDCHRKHLPPSLPLVSARPCPGRINSGRPLPLPRPKTDPVLIGRLSLLVDQQQRCDRTRRLDRHADSPPSPASSPRRCAGTGRESVGRK